MARLLLLCLSLQVLWLHVSAQCRSPDEPGDADEDCIDPKTFRIIAPVYDENQCALLDSRHYETLVGSGGVWNPVEYDNNGGAVSACTK